MGRNAVSFKRKDSRFDPQPTTLILCEDLKSSKIYLEDAAIYFRANAKVEFSHCGVTHPEGILEEAVRRQGSFDRVFCAIDRDTHESFEAALQIARNHEKITIIASYPCFEFWLLLHYGFTRKPFHRAGKKSPAEVLANHLKNKPGMENYHKNGAAGYFSLLQGKQFSEARKHAPRVLKDATDSNELNPSTQIHMLMDFFEELSSPKLATPKPQKNKHA